MSLPTKVTDFATDLAQYINQRIAGTINDAQLIGDIVALFVSNNLTDTALALRISSLVANSETQADQLSEWLTGPADGGFTADGSTEGGGYYPFTDAGGITIYLPSLLKQAELIVAGASDSITTAVTDAVNAAGLSAYEQAVANGFVGTAAEWLDSLIHPAPVVITANHVAVDGEILLADTSGGAFNVTLPATPRDDARVTIVDKMGTFDVHPVTVLRNGHTIGWDIENLVLDQLGVILELRYTGNTWVYPL